MIRKLSSILLIVATTVATALSATLWVGSYALERELQGHHGPMILPGWSLEHSFDDTHEIRVWGRQGGFEVYYDWHHDDGDMAPTSQGIERRRKAFAGFSFGGWTIGDWEMRYAEVPFWFLVLTFGSCPTLAFIRGPFRRWRRRRKGWCLHCGYDLKGNVSGVCPECGGKV